MVWVIFIWYMHIYFLNKWKFWHLFECIHQRTKCIFYSDLPSNNWKERRKVIFLNSFYLPSYINNIVQPEKFCVLFERYIFTQYKLSFFLIIKECENIDLPKIFMNTNKKKKKKIIAYTESCHNFVRVNYEDENVGKWGN